MAEAIEAVFAAMSVSPQHTFQILTKRPARMRDYINEVCESGRWLAWTHPRLGHPLYDATVAQWDVMFRHVWLGVSVENQQAADDRIPILLATPAALRFLSCEPLLGPLNLEGYLVDLEIGAGIDWIIVGGESGPGARIMQVEWARSIRDQCAFFRKPLFHKQNGEWEPGDGDTPQGQQYYKVGKKAAGSLLDGVSHKEFPA
jgi:protein gp37